MLAWPQPIRQDPLRLDHSRRGHTPACTAPSRTASRLDPLWQPMVARPRAGLLVARPHPVRGSGVAGSV
jgi:hypothetical protein